MLFLTQIAPCAGKGHHRRGHADQPPRILNLLKERGIRPGQTAGPVPREQRRRARQKQAGERQKRPAEPVLLQNRLLSAVHIQMRQQQAAAQHERQTRHHADGVGEVRRLVGQIGVLSGESDKERARAQHMLARHDRHAGVDARPREVEERHEKPSRAQHEEQRRLRACEDAPRLTDEPLCAQQRRERAKRGGKQRAEQMAHEDARHRQRQQRPPALVPREHLDHREKQQREEDHRQALAQRRADVEVGNPVAAQRVQRRRAQRDAPLMKHAARAEIAHSCRREVDHQLKHAHACRERHAQVAQHGGDVQEQLRIELRRGIAVAQQCRRVNAHGELARAQAGGDALDAVEVEEQIVPVVDARKEQRHAGKQRDGHHRQRVAAALTPDGPRVPGEREQRRQHGARQRCIRRQIAREHARARLVYSDSANLRILRHVHREGHLLAGVRQREGKAHRAVHGGQRPLPVLDERLAQRADRAQGKRLRRGIRHRNLIGAPHQVEAQRLIDRFSRFGRTAVLLVLVPHALARAGTLLFQRHRLLRGCLVLLRLPRADEHLGKLLALKRPGVLASVRIEEDQHQEHQPQRRHAHDLFLHIQTSAQGIRIHDIFIISRRRAMRKNKQPPHRAGLQKQSILPRPAEEDGSSFAVSLAVISSLGAQ